ncbi:uncharacterized protein LOC144450866 [Glandiceps talaboti]
MNGEPGPWTAAFTPSDCAKSIVSAGNIVEPVDPVILTTPGIHTEAPVPPTEEPEIPVVTATCEHQSTDVCDSTGASPCRVSCPAGCASASRNVWGTGYYTGDSSLCKAAVHSGAITNEAGGVVDVSFRDGDSSYTGSTRNGVTTTSYGAWSVTFWFGDSDVLPTLEPEIIEANCEHQSTDVCDSSAATVCRVRCPAGCASASRNVWGTGYYAGDSSLCKAAVHSGVITNAAGGVVDVSFRDGDSSYTGSTRNGVTTTSYGAWSVTFWFGDSDVLPTLEPEIIEANCEHQSTDVCDSSSATVCRVRCPAGCASASRNVWGTGYYTGDSSLCKAAVHDGAITNAAGGVVDVSFRDGDSSYTASTKNGVTTTSYGAWSVTFWF